MRQEDKTTESGVKNAKDFLIPLIFILAIIYMIAGTGVFSDDFVNIKKTSGKSVLEVLSGKFYFIETPVEFFTHYIWYPLFTIDGVIAVSILKIIYTILEFWLIALFFGLFADKITAYFISFIFLFLPTHDSTVYWLVGHYLTLSVALYMFSYYLAEKGRLAWGSIFAVLASFLSYGSGPVALSLSALLFIRKKVKASLCILIPNLIYTGYYLWTAKLGHSGVDKLSGGEGVLGVIKSFIVQILSSADVMAGPSMWMKTVYGIGCISVTGIIFAAILCFFYFRNARVKDDSLNKELSTALFLMFALSLVMFSLTGMYPQLAFNLGNRVTVFGAVFFVYIIMTAGRLKNVRLVLVPFLIFSIFGTSGHWKEFTRKEIGILHNIKENKLLAAYSGEKPLYIAGCQYSILGDQSHIEFMSEAWVTGSIFDVIYGGKIRAWPLNKRYVYKDGYLIDNKYGRQDKVVDHINVYDCGKNALLKIPADGINYYIESLPSYKRHWLQGLNIPLVRKMIRDV